MGPWRVMKKFAGPFLVVAALALFYQLAWNGDVWNQSLEKLTSMASLVDDNYYQDVDAQKMAFSSIRGMLLTLDPHSYFLDPDNFSRLREDQVGLYSGIGIQIQKQEDRLVVISPRRIPNFSRMTLAMGAMQLVVQEALDTM